MIFLKQFQGKQVQIITKLTMLTDQGPAPLIEMGFVVDCDNTFLYLGVENPLEISKCIALSEIVMVDSNVADESDMLMLNVGTGSGNEEMN